MEKQKYLTFFHEHWTSVKIYKLVGIDQSLCKFNNAKYEGYEYHKIFTSGSSIKAFMPWSGPMCATWLKFVGPEMIRDFLSNSRLQQTNSLQQMLNTSFLHYIFPQCLHLSNCQSTLKTQWMFRICLRWVSKTSYLRHPQFSLDKPVESHRCV